MTPEQILDLVDKEISSLEAMSEEQLLEYFKPYLDNTRPQIVVVPEKSKGKINLADVPDAGTKPPRSKSKGKSKSGNLIDKIQELALMHGVDIKSKLDLPKDLR